MLEKEGLYVLKDTYLGLKDNDLELFLGHFGWNRYIETDIIFIFLYVTLV